MRESSRIDASSSNRAEQWLRAVVAEPGMTSLDLERAHERLLEDSLRAVELLSSTTGPIVDVGSGNGAPGIPLALALPERELTLLDASRRRCDFLERWRPANARVVWGRAEEQETDWAGASVAKALAPPVVAAEWCLPLVRPGGLSVLWVGATLEADELRPVAERLGAEVEPGPRGLLLLRKLAATPPGFPRRAGVARRRPLS